ncbi:hypothetical protein [Mesorhizobium escarrei]|nr:hypothetical protein [Mesorhizobium escarrei]
MIQTNANAPTIRAELQELIDRLRACQKVPDPIAVVLIDHAESEVEGLSDDNAVIDDTDPVFTTMDALMTAIEERTEADLDDDEGIA